MVYRSSHSGPVFGLRREIDRLFEDTFGRDAGRENGWSPAVDVREDPREIVLEVELPGVKPTDVEVTAENGVLTIRGEKQGTTTEGKEGRYHVVERTYGTFLRSFQLPQGVDENGIEAEFADGVLAVHVPKAALPQPRRIEIRNSGSQPVIQGEGARSSTTSGSATSGKSTDQHALGTSRRSGPRTPDDGGSEARQATGDASSEGSRARTQSRTSR